MEWVSMGVYQQDFKKHIKGHGLQLRQAPLQAAGIRSLEQLFTEATLVVGLFQFQYYQRTEWKKVRSRLLTCTPQYLARTAPPP